MAEVLLRLLKGYAKNLEYVLIEELSIENLG
jgi:hypothetical protein